MAGHGIRDTIDPATNGFLAALTRARHPFWRARITGEH